MDPHSAEPLLITNGDSNLKISACKTVSVQD